MKSINFDAVVSSKYITSATTILENVFGRIVAGADDISLGKMVSVKYQSSGKEIKTSDIGTKAGEASCLAYISGELNEKISELVGEEIVKGIVNKTYTVPEAVLVAKVSAEILAGNDPGKMQFPDVVDSKETDSYVVTG